MDHTGQGLLVSAIEGLFPKAIKHHEDIQYSVHACNGRGGPVFITRELRPQENTRTFHIEFVGSDLTSLQLIQQGSTLMMYMNADSRRVWTNVNKELGISIYRYTLFGIPVSRWITKREKLKGQFYVYNKASHAWREYID